MWGLRAGDRIRTDEYQLGRLTPYHLATPACAMILPWSAQGVKRSRPLLLLDSSERTFYNPSHILSLVLCFSMETVGHIYPRAKPNFNVILPKMTIGNPLTM